MSRRVLVIEDSADISGLVSMHLKDMHCDVVQSHDGLEGLSRAMQEKFDLIILDLMLPGIEGLEVCRRLRERPNYTPILMLTAKSSELDRVLGLEVGADDYLTKPFSIRELMARVKALFRRIENLGSPAAAPIETMQFGDMTIDIERRRVNLGERSIDLTAKEFDLLLHFAQHPGRVYSRTQLLDTVWGYSHEGYEHTVNSHINRLRGKIEDDPAKPNYILTVWGVGYKFNDQLAA